MVRIHKQRHISERQPARDLQPRSKTFSYYKARLPSEETNRKPSVEKSTSGWRRHKSGLRHAPVFVVLVVLIGFAIYQLGLSSTPKIVIVDGSATTQTFMHTPSQYAEAAQKLFNGSISSRTKLTINTTALVASIQQQFPELASASITLPVLGHQPVLYLVPAKPAVILSSQTAGSFLLSSSGTVLAHSTPHTIGTSNLPILTDQTGQQIVVGHRVLASSDVGFVQLVVAQLQAKQISIKSLVLPAASRDLDVYIEGQPYFVKFNLNDSTDAAQQIGTFLATNQYLANNHIVPSQYIDARVLGRVYYK
ncbi:MAG TPA: hypothetical protein VMR28_00935 [Candidatus Saccharimonadales bacterium]|nr:hypothetical protein [Candidatus Saccharimonadales bacterium]